MHQRVRWENVIRAAAASLLLAMIVAWPRLAPPDPALPGADPAPLAAGEPPAEPPPPRVREPARPREAHARVKGGRRLRAAKRRNRRSERPREARTRHRRVPQRDEPATTGGPVRANGREPAAGGGTTGETAPPPDPAQIEFGFEGG